MNVDFGHSSILSTAFDTVSHYAELTKHRVYIEETALRFPYSLQRSVKVTIDDFVFSCGVVLAWLRPPSPQLSFRQESVW